MSLQCEVPLQPRRCQSQTAAVGIDVGIATAIIQSDSVAVPLPASIRRARKSERRLQRAIARAKRGSRRRQKARERFARAKRKTAEIRRQWQHKQAARLTRCYALVAVEDLALANMTRSAKGTVENPGNDVKAKAGLNRALLDGGLAGLVEKLAYKAERDASRMVAVDPRFTSQKYSRCGAIVPKTLAQRTHHCRACDLVLDRDANAAKNILALALNGAAPSGSAASAAGAGRPLRGGRNNGDIGRRALGNTASSSSADGDGECRHTKPTQQPGDGGIIGTARKAGRKRLISRDDLRPPWQ
jgi:putative transposase